MRSLRHFLPNWGRLTLKNGGRAVPLASPLWRTLYVAALFEADERRMPQRIAEAKNALAVRAHELFLTSENHLQEQSDIDEAFQALHALEQCAAHLLIQQK